MDEIQSLPLSRLKEGTPGITAAVGEALAQAAAVCLEDQEHSSGEKTRCRAFIIIFRFPSGKRDARSGADDGRLIRFGKNFVHQVRT